LKLIGSLHRKITQKSYYNESMWITISDREEVVDGT
jgi:hypothetical protein